MSLVEIEATYSKMPMPHSVLSLQEQSLGSEEVISLLKNVLTDERVAKIDKVIASRTDQLIPVLENIYDRGNTNAVMRSAEAFGFYKFFVINPEGAKQKESNRITKGTHKWLDIHQYHSAATAVKDLK